jgi:hypothetical protein
MEKGFDLHAYLLPAGYLWHHSRVTVTLGEDTSADQEHVAVHLVHIFSRFSVCLLVSLYGVK